MSLYEGMFLMDNRQANRDWDGSLEKLKAILTKHGAEPVRCLKWGERKLGYDIKGRRRGTYVLTYFNATGDAVSRIYREVELSELIHRALILKVAKLPSEDEMWVTSDTSAPRRFARSTGPASEEGPPRRTGRRPAKPEEEEEPDDEEESEAPAAEAESATTAE